MATGAASARRALDSGCRVAPQLGAASLTSVSADGQVLEAAVLPPGRSERQPHRSQPGVTTDRSRRMALRFWRLWISRTAVCYGQATTLTYAWTVRFAKIHPSFLIFFFLSLLSMTGALALAIAATQVCGGSSSSASTETRCVVEAQGLSTMAMVLAIGGLTAMLGGVGFQVGRARPPAPTPPQNVAFPGPYPYAPTPAATPTPPGPGQPPAPPVERQS